MAQRAMSLAPTGGAATGGRVRPIWSMVSCWRNVPGAASPDGSRRGGSEGIAGLPSSKCTTVAWPGVVSVSSWFFTERSTVVVRRPSTEPSATDTAVQVRVSPFMLRPRNSQRKSAMSPSSPSQSASRLWR